MPNEYYENSNLWGRTELTLCQRQVASVLQRLCRGLPEKSVIGDLGCGDGVLLRPLLNWRPGLIGHGMDGSAEALKHLAPPAIGSRGDISQMPYPDDFFDVCYCIDVLEHVPPNALRKALQEIFRVCKGSVLLVTPFLESDTIRTVCPHCDCVFSPYYHVNRFSLTAWERLLAPHMAGRTMRFLPLGTAKTHIPSGVGGLFVAAGGRILHPHETICPQCQLRFNQPVPGDVTMLSEFLAPLADRHRERFLWTYEEMGVLIQPNALVKAPLNEATEDGIWWQAHGNPNTATKVHVRTQSQNKISFADETSFRPGAELFRGPAYAINSTALDLDETGVRCWRLQPGYRENVDNVLTIALPPDPHRSSQQLELCMRAKSPGKLLVSQTGMANQDRVTLASAELGASRETKVIAFATRDEAGFVTPHGILIQLLWEPANPQRGAELELLSLEDPTRPDQSTALPAKTWSRWPFVPTVGYTYGFTVSAAPGLEQPDIELIYRLKDRWFDLSGQIATAIAEGNRTAPAMLFPELLEELGPTTANLDATGQWMKHEAHAAGVQVFTLVRDLLTKTRIKTTEPAPQSNLFWRMVGR